MIHYDKYEGEILQMSLYHQTKRLDLDLLKLRIEEVGSIRDNVIKRKGITEELLKIEEIYLGYLIFYKEAVKENTEEEIERLRFLTSININK